MQEIPDIISWSIQNTHIQPAIMGAWTYQGKNFMNIVYSFITRRQNYFTKPYGENLPELDRENKRNSEPDLFTTQTFRTQRTTQTIRQPRDESLACFCVVFFEEYLIVCQQILWGNQQAQHVGTPQ